MTNNTRRRLKIFNQIVMLTADEYGETVATMRRSDKLSTVTAGLDEEALLKMLAVEKDSKDRVFVIERLYIKYKKARERREKVELLTN
jgi:AmiR/NasT family two-component response regulator